jgi:molecular chaperone GrpE
MRPGFHPWRLELITPDTPDDDLPQMPEATVEGDAAPEALIGEAQWEEIIKVFQAENEELKAQNLRLRADMENMRKRFEKEKEEAGKYAVTKFAADVVNVADNFERAVAAVPPGAADADEALKSLVDGVTMTEREFINTLERHGVKRINPEGEMFNPHRHQAVMETAVDGVANGTVVKVFQPGYMISDRVLRPAMVVVAKGGKPAADDPVADVNGESSDETAPDA